MKNALLLDLNQIIRDYHFNQTPHTAQLTNMENQNPQYYYVSLKWTHKNDAFITLWGPNSNGYQWYQSWIGKYSEPYDPSADSVKSVLCDVADPLFEKVRFDGKEVMILPNTESVRAILGIRKAEFQRSYRSHCPDINELDYIKADAPGNEYPGKQHQELFDHMSEQHQLTLLSSEMDEIIDICKKIIINRACQEAMDAGLGVSEWRSFLNYKA